MTVVAWIFFMVFGLIGFTFLIKLIFSCINILELILLVFSIIVFAFSAGYLFGGLTL